MASASIFQQYLKPPKSITEYGAELDAGEANQLSLAEARRKGVASDQAMKEQNAFKAALAGGLDLEAQGGLQKGLAVAPSLALDTYKKMSDARKVRAGAGKDDADAVKTRFETGRAKIQQAINDISLINDPDSYVNSIIEKQRSGELPAETAATILRNMPANPQEFSAYKEKILGMMRTQDQQLRAAETFLQTLDSGGKIQQQLRYKAGGGIVPGTEQTIEKTPAPVDQSVLDERKARIRALDAAAQGNMPAGSLSVGGGMSVPMPGGGAQPQAGAPVSPQAFPRVSPEVQLQRNAEQVALLQRELAQPVNSNPQDQQRIQAEIARLSGGQAFPATSGDPAPVTNPAAPLPQDSQPVRMAQPAAAFVRKEFPGSTPLPGETRNTFTARQAREKLQWDANQNALERDAIKQGNKTPSITVQKESLSQQKQFREIESVISELNQITKPGGLIDKSTGSGVGAIVDMAGRAVGKSTKGGVAIAQLKPIADMVLKLVPRFEGPQSDKDVQSYLDASGRIADPTYTTQERKAAAREIVRIMTKRKGQFTLKDLPVSSFTQPQVSDAPEGVDPALWGAMTPDERALWQK